MVGSNKPTNKHTHTRAQCSHASVGLAQARPNNKDQEIFTLKNICTRATNNKNFMHKKLNTYTCTLHAANIAQLSIVLTRNIILTFVVAMELTVLAC